MDAQMRINLVLSFIDKANGAIGKSMDVAQGKLSSFSKKSSELADRSFKTGQQLIASGVAVAAPLYKAFEAASAFETKMVDIGKQIESNGPEEYAAKMANMSKQVMQLGKELPLATGEIQEMMASGLRMGIKEADIVGFTKDVTKMATAFDMPAADIADSMGKIANVFKIPIGEIGDFADAINYLDDNTMAKGPDIINVLQRIGGTAKYLEKNDAAALAATMLSLGESSETAGSGINAMMNKLGAATMQSKKFQAGINMLGLDSKKIQADMADKSTAKLAIIEVFEKINGLKPKEQTEALSRLFGADHGPKLAKLANNMEAFKKQLLMVTGAEKGSMNKEYQRRIETSAAQMQIFKNRIDALWVTIGKSLLPVVNQIIQKASVWIDKIGQFIQDNPVLVSWILKAAVAFSALSIAGGYLSFVIGGVAKAISIGSTVLGGLAKAFRFVSMAVSFMSKVLLANPILLIIMAIAVAAFLIYKYWDQIKAFFIRLWEGVKIIFKKFVDGIKYVFLNFTPHGLIIKHWDKIKAFFIKIWDGVKETFWNAVDWLTSLGTKFFEAGKNIIKSIIQGLKSMINDPIKFVKDMVGKIRDMLPFSPAKTGPLKDIHRLKLVETIAQNVKPAPMVNAMQKVTGASYDALKNAGAGQSFAANGAAGTGAGSGTTVNFNISLNGGTKNDAALVAAECKKQFQVWMKDYNHQQNRVKFA